MSILSSVLVQRWRFLESSVEQLAQLTRRQLRFAPNAPGRSIWAIFFWALEKRSDSRKVDHLQRLLGGMVFQRTCQMVDFGEPWLHRSASPGGKWGPGSGSMQGEQDGRGRLAPGTERMASVEENDWPTWKGV